MIDWINEFFGIKNEVTVPTLISLIVFIVGGIISYLFTKIREINQRKANRKTFILLLNEVIRDLNLKEKNIAKFYPQINLLNEKSFYITLSSISYLETIFEFDFKEIYYSFRKKFFWNPYHSRLKNKAFHKIWAILRKQKYFDEKIQTSLIDLSTRYNSDVKSYYTSLEEYRKYNDEIMHKYEGFDHDKKDLELYKYLKESDNIWFAWQNLGEIRTFHYYSYNNLVIPMLELNRKNSALEITLKSSELLLNCFTSYMEIENIVNSYQTQFIIYHKIFVHDQRILKKCLSIIQ